MKSYLGCFRDKIKVEERILPHALWIDTRITVDECTRRCAERGFRVAGLQFGRECWCGVNPPSSEYRVDDMNCQMKCAGDSSYYCGGELVLSAYSVEPKVPVDDRPLLALVMILKDEAHTILDTLNTVKDIVDVWYILDTGSTDGTQKIIQDFFRERKIPGKLFEEPFVDYGATRNRILELAYEQDPKPVFTLMLSADEQIQNPRDLRNFVEEFRYATGPQHEAYPVIMRAGSEFDSVRLARVDDKWRYVGRVHEYLTNSRNEWRDLWRPIPPIKVNFKATDGERRFKSQFMIARILKEELEKNPNDCRSLLYLARTMIIVGNYSDSYDYFEKLAQVSAWNEEVYFCMYSQAEVLQLMNRPWYEIENKMLSAYKYMPQKLDAIYYIASHYYDSQQYSAAYMYAQIGAKVPLPENWLKIQNLYFRTVKYIYDFEMSRTLGYSAMRIGDYRTCFHYLLNASKFDENRNKDYDLQISRECQSKIVDSASDYNRITYKYQSSETVDENSSLYIVALPAVIFLLILFQIFQRRKRKYRSD